MFKKEYNYIKVTILILGLYFLPLFSYASTLSLSPSTGVYSVGNVFTVRVLVNTSGKAINAAEGTINFNPNEFAVVSIDRSGSIFNLWVAEPTFSNTAGTINFSGGAPSGYTGNSGTIFNVNLRAKSATTAKLKFSSGAVLANDGQGTNIISGMNGGTYTVSAVSSSPEPEVVQYVAPPNTPEAPNIKSSTHPDENSWYANKVAELSWVVPEGIVAVRTLLDQTSHSIPTKTYEEKLSSINLEDLDEGVSFFHLQFKNADGWGKVKQFRLAVDTEKPESFTIALATDNDSASPKQKLELKIIDKTSPVTKFKIKIGEAEPFDYEDKEQKGTVELPALDPGYHTVIIEAFDSAQNSTIQSFAFTIQAFTKPEFFEYPTEINEEVIPVLKGKTKANANVEVVIQKLGGEPTVYKVLSDDNGEFTFIPSGRLSTGVYEVVAKATDQYGGVSLPSEVIKIAVQEPGYVQIGSFLINLLSVIVPLVALVILMILSIWFGLIRWRKFKMTLRLESGEAESMLHHEFAEIRQVVEDAQSELLNGKRTKKLTGTELEIFVKIGEALNVAERKIGKEVLDVEKLADKK